MNILYILRIRGLLWTSGNGPALARALVGENTEILVFCRGVARGELNGPKNEIIACREGFLTNWRHPGEAKHAGLQQKEREDGGRRQDA
jgi:hypothetical protein